MKMIKLTNQLFWLLTSVLLLSCSDIEEVDTSILTDNNAKIKVTIQMPQASPKTYAISDKDENEVKTVDMLAFVKDDSKASGWAYAYSAKGKDIVDLGGANNSKKQFYVTLIKNDSEQYFVALANVDEEITKLGQIARGADKNELLHRLISSNEGQWNANQEKDENDESKTFDAFPMWGEVKTTITDGTKEITGLSLIRAVARLDIKLDNELISAGSFKLNQIYVHNTKKSGHIVPYADNVAAGTVTKPTIPSGSINNESPLKYIVPESMQDAFLRSIYLYESQAAEENHSSEATCVVVGGTYQDDSQPTYYRLDFLESDQKTYRDILRNHKYTLNIKSVAGSGYSTEDEAFKSKALNMVVEVLEWDDADLGDIYDKDGYYLKISPKSEFEFGKDRDDQTVTIQTDYPGGWQLVKLVELGEDNETEQPVTDNWFSIDKTVGNYYGSDKEKIDVNMGITDNNTGAVRIGYMYVRAGRQTVKIKVKQAIESTLMLRLEDVTGGSTVSDIRELEFPSGIWNVDPIETKSINVSWVPYLDDNPCLVMPKALQGGGIQFVSGADLPIVNTILSDDNGKVSYNIKPKPFTTGEVAPPNEFLVRSTQYTYMVHDGVNTKKKLFLINQVHYNLVSDALSGYLTDGRTYRFFVRSNVGFRIKAIEETNILGSLSTLLDLSTNDNLKVDTKGGNDITTGTEIRFTTKNNISGAANKITITFENTDTPQKMDDVKIEFYLTAEYYPPAHRGWAGSNIYWDEEKMKMTFDDAGSTEHQNYQGLVFQWGGLWAMSPESYSFSGSTRLYDPTREGVVGTASSFGVQSGNYKYYGNRISDIVIKSYLPESNERDRSYLYELEQESSGKGDICKYLTDKGWAPGSQTGTKWRMPTSNEFEAFSNYQREGSWGNDKSYDSKGTKVMKAYYTRTDETGTANFPASGYRNCDNGGGNGQGDTSQYWSASPSFEKTSNIPASVGQLEAHALFLQENGGDTGARKKRSEGCYIRCVKE